MQQMLCSNRTDLSGDVCGSRRGTGDKIYKNSVTNFLW